MKKMIFAAFAALLTIGCSNPTKVENETITDTILQEMEYIPNRQDSLTAMFNAFCRQESEGNVLAVSPCGLYVGCLQMSKIMVREANRLIGDSIYDYEDRFDPDCSFGMFMAVMEGRNPSLDIDKAINLWNEKCPDIYRNNVKAYYEENLSLIKSMI